MTPREHVDRFFDTVYDKHCSYGQVSRAAITRLVEEAIAEEREACAQVAINVGICRHAQTAAEIADAIRARGKQRIAEFEAALRFQDPRNATTRSATATKDENQCDGCRMGYPADENGNHVMRSISGYAKNLMRCQAMKPCPGVLNPITGHVVEKCHNGKNTDYTGEGVNCSMCNGTGVVRDVNLDSHKEKP